jgi:hypothetical protein
VRIEGETVNLMDLFVKVAYDDKDVDKGIDGTSKKGAGFAKGLGKAFGGAAKVVGAISTAAIALGGAFVKGAMDVADYGSEVNDMSQKLNMSAKGFQEWKYILGQSGVDIGVLQGGMKKLSESAVAGSESFKTLGISQDDLSKLSTEELFNKTITQLSSMEAGNERTALAADLFGRSATELLPILNEGAGGIEAMRKQAEDYGLVMSDEAIAASDAFGDSVSLMQQTLTGMKNRMMGEFLPSLTLVTDGLAKLFTGDTSGLDSINKGIGQFVDKISQAMPQIIEVGGSILQALATAIMQNMPLLVTAAFDLISQFAGFVLENIPMLLETALAILTTLALGITEQAPTLIPAIVETFLTIIDTLINNIPLLVSAASQLMTGLAQGLTIAIPLLVNEIPTIILALVNAIVANLPMLLQSAGDIIAALAIGLVNAIPVLLKALPEILKAIVKGFKELAPKIKEIGKNMIEGIWAGIKDSVQWMKDKIKGWVGDVMAFIKGLFGIESPSKVMREEVGKMLSYGLGDGIMKYAGYAKNAMSALMDGVMGETYNPTISASVTGSAGLYGDSTIGGAFGGGVSIGQINFNQPVKTPTQFTSALQRMERAQIYG